MAKKFTLNKNERLKSRKKIGGLFREGKKLSVPPFLIYYSIFPLLTQSQQQPAIKMGAAVSSKNFKKAVDRNTIKRKIKEAYRLQNTQLKEGLQEIPFGMDVFFIYTEKVLPVYAELSAKMLVALQKLCVLLIKK